MQESIYECILHNFLHWTNWIRIWPQNEFWWDSGRRFANEFRGERYKQIGAIPPQRCIFSIFNSGLFLLHWKNCWQCSFLNKVSEQVRHFFLYELLNLYWNLCSMLGISVLDIGSRLITALYTATGTWTQAVGDLKGHFHHIRTDWKNRIVIKASKKYTSLWTFGNHISKAILFLRVFTRA